MKNKERLDVLLVSRGLAESRAKAQALIMSGQVYVDNQKADKAGASFAQDAAIEVRGDACPYVSRGGLKLAKALRDFGVDPTGYVCSDSGASTGGFTDCLLQHGAAKVFAIDVGYGQLAWSIRSDPRVVTMERTNIRYVKPEDLGEPLDLSVVDVSFISLRIVLPAIRSLLKPSGQVLCPVSYTHLDVYKRQGCRRWRFSLAVPVNWAWWEARCWTWSRSSGPARRRRFWTFKPGRPGR